MALRRKQEGEGRMGQEGIQGYLEGLKKLGCVLGLENMYRLMGELGDIQDKLKVIHVAGTNGKGSVCAMLSSVLREAGYQVGTYTSPAVFCKQEQYQVNGEAIEEGEFKGIIQDVREACRRMAEKGMAQPTVFEVETAAAFLWFFRKGCQVAVVEAGLGGREDATNIIKKPLVSVLTSISMDHQDYLGDSLARIAQEKAGIIKEGGIAVVAKPRQAEVRQAVEAVCREKHAKLVYAKEGEAGNLRFCQGKLCFSYGGIGETALSMLGAFQVQNSICVIKAVESLQALGWEIPVPAIRRGLEKAQWEGRFSVLSRNLLFVIDGAAEKLRETLKMGFTNRRIIYIIGVLADKEHEKILQCMLPLAWKVFTVTPDSPRAMDGRDLAKEARKYHQDVTFCPEIPEAVGQSLEIAAEGHAMVLAFGSLSYLGEIKKALKEKRGND